MRAAGADAITSHVASQSFSHSLKGLYSTFFPVALFASAVPSCPHKLAGLIVSSQAPIVPTTFFPTSTAGAIVVSTLCCRLVTACTGLVFKSCTKSFAPCAALPISFPAASVSSPALYQALYILPLIESSSDAIYCLCYKIIVQLEYFID